MIIGHYINICIEERLDVRAQDEDDMWWEAQDGVYGTVWKCCYNQRTADQVLFLGEVDDLYNDCEDDPGKYQCSDACCRPSLTV